MHLKQYEIVQNQDLLTVDIQEVMMTHKTIKHYAYILHDKDDTRPHYHIYVNFGNSGVDSADVAKWFGVPENFVNKIHGRRTDMLLYLTHGQENQKHKHQYSPSEVVANFDFELEIEKSKILGNFEKYREGAGAPGRPGAAKTAKMYKAGGGGVVFPVKISLDFPNRPWYNPKLRRCACRLALLCSQAGGPVPAGGRTCAAADVQKPSWRACRSRGKGVSLWAQKRTGNSDEEIFQGTAFHSEELPRRSGSQGAAV